MAAEPRIELITTYLEMSERPNLQVKGPNRAGMLLRLEDTTASFYRYLYEAVGEAWLWWARRSLSDAELLALVTDSEIDVFVLYMGGVPAGFFELDRRIEKDVELVHFGFLPEFIGRGLGKWLLASATETAWDHEPDRLWATITNFDHSRALLTYQWAGFVPYETKRELIDDPRV
jgi:GNAT superfamily N-acetyltransferase